jgi:hypothetical protein
MPWDLQDCTHDITSFYCCSYGKCENSVVIDGKISESFQAVGGMHMKLAGR